jgi:Fe-S-cluster containining protein
LGRTGEGETVRRTVASRFLDWNVARMGAMFGAAVARFGARVSALATDALAGAREESDLVALLERVWAAIDEELAQRPERAPPPACGPGCACCCSVNVATLPLEGAVAAARLRSALGERAKGMLAASLLSFHERIRWLEDRHRYAERLVCPFVDERGRCAIHAVRPLACRSVTSLDRADCRRAVAGDADDDAPLVRMDLLHKALHDEALAALGNALAARGLDARRRDVSGMTGTFLADSGLVAAFLAGRRVPLQ